MDTYHVGATHFLCLLIFKSMLIKSSGQITSIQEVSYHSIAERIYCKLNVEY